jgi:quinol monooxygenase YgiN
MEPLYNPVSGYSLKVISARGNFRYIFNFSMKKQFLYLWEYLVKEDCIDRFKQYYAADGEWVKLFKKAPGFISTELIRDLEFPNRFITIDNWKSRKDRDNFRSQFSRV